MNQNDEEIVMNVILMAGDARNSALEAINYAKEANFEMANESLSKGEESLNKAHEIQFKFLSDEANGIKHELTLLTVHSQDHLMNAITIMDLAKADIELWRQLHELKKEIKV